HGAMRGDGARVGFEVNISDPEYAWMTFYYDVTDAVESNTSLIHARIRIDRRIVWESPTEGKMRDGVIEVDLRPFVTRRGRIRVDFELVTERTGVPEQLPVIVRFDDVRIWGVGRHPERFAADLDFREREMGKFRITTTP